ncbi:MAG: hypothetical protein IPO92_13585 [Saprospiraceae bacterium]|nr:hypothetical protein [Saprospiraceae bacterium]
MAWQPVGQYCGNIQNNIGKYKINSIYPDYSANPSSLQSGADNVKADINAVIGTAVVNTDKNFIIAHSLGGLITRTMGQLPNGSGGGKAFNGMITFGTPHQGVAAANTLVNNPQILTKLADDACNSLLIGPIYEEILYSDMTFGPWILAAGGFIVDAILDGACQNATDVGIPAAISVLSTGIEPSLTTTAASSIPPMVTDHRLFYGIEDGNTDGTLTPRFFGAFFNPPGSYPVFGADASDAAGLTRYASELGSYVLDFNFWEAQSVPWYAWVLPHIAIRDEIIISKMRHAFKEGVDWFPTIDPTWKHLIGSAELEIINTGECQCVVYDYANPVYSYVLPNTSGDCSSGDSGGNTSSTECSTIYSSNFIYKPNDGFILAESAMNGPGANYPVQVMLGSNHFQMRNDSKTRLATMLIFEEGIGQTYFKSIK